MSASFDRDPAPANLTNGTESFAGSVPKSVELAAGPAAELARCFLRLANPPNYALDRLSRYEASHWRQAGQILFALDVLDRRIATPYHAWERGLNENTNGLIRDFFPKGTDFSTIANAEVAKVERLLNARPRKSLGFRSPQEVFDSLAHS